MRAYSVVPRGDRNTVLSGEPQSRFESCLRLPVPAAELLFRCSVNWHGTSLVVNRCETAARAEAIDVPQSLVREYDDGVGSISYAGGQADIVLDESPRPGGFHRGAGGPT